MMAAATQQPLQHQQLHHHNSLQVLHAHSIQGMPHGLGLLTTVASLPPKYRSRYLKIQTKCEIPLDLSVKPLSPLNLNGDTGEVPMAVNFTEVYTEPEPCSDTQSQASEDIVEEICTSLADSNESHYTTTTTTTASITITHHPLNQNRQQQQQHNKPITPPLTPTKRKYSESDLDTDQEYKENQRKVVKIESNFNKQPLVESTPAKQPIKTSDTAPKTAKNQMVAAAASTVSKAQRTNKATRKLKFDEETSSPVSGTIIRPLEDITDGAVQYSNGDIDPKYNIVEITEETKAELAAIKNVIGDYVCRLCRIKFDDAFGLAQHRCACIVLLEYRCPECGKQFNCPANLASHRRWHKPRKTAGGPSTSSAAAAVMVTGKQDIREKKTSKKSESEGDVVSYGCQECGKKFKRQAYLKKHELTHQKSGIIVSVPVANPVLSSNNVIQSTNDSEHNNSPQQSPQQNEEVVYVAHSYTEEDPEDSMSGYSSSGSSSHQYGRLQIVETGLTEEENIAAAALTNLRNCASVIQHTTLAH